MKIEQIIIHHSLTADSKTVSWGAIRRYHVETLGWVDIGYTYGIELIGGDFEILCGRMLDMPGAHTKGQNTDSIGICMVGNFDLAPPLPKQWELLAKLCKSLCRVFDIKLSKIKGHRDFADKTCPGKMVDMQLLRDDVARLVIGRIQESGGY